MNMICCTITKNAILFGNFKQFEKQFFLIRFTKKRITRQKCIWCRPRAMLLKATSTKVSTIRAKMRNDLMKIMTIDSSYKRTKIFYLISLVWSILFVFCKNWEQNNLLLRFTDLYTANMYSGITVEVQLKNCTFEKLQFFTVDHSSLYFLLVKNCNLSII